MLGCSIARSTPQRHSPFDHVPILTPSSPTPPIPIHHPVVIRSWAIMEKTKELPPPPPLLTDAKAIDTNAHHRAEFQGSTSERTLTPESLLQNRAVAARNFNRSKYLWMLGQKVQGAKAGDPFLWFSGGKPYVVEFALGEGEAWMFLSGTDHRWAPHTTLTNSEVGTPSQVIVLEAHKQPGTLSVASFCWCLVGNELRVIIPLSSGAGCDGCGVYTYVKAYFVCMDTPCGSTFIETVSKTNETQVLWPHFHSLATSHNPRPVATSTPRRSCSAITKCFLSTAMVRSRASISIMIHARSSSLGSTQTTPGSTTAFTSSTAWKWLCMAMGP